MVCQARDFKRRRKFSFFQITRFSLKGVISKVLLGQQGIQRSKSRFLLLTVSCCKRRPVFAVAWQTKAKAAIASTAFKLAIVRQASGLENATTVVGYLYKFKYTPFTHLWSLSTTLTSPCSSCHAASVLQTRHRGACGSLLYAIENKGGETL